MFLSLPYFCPINFVQKYKKVQKYANKTDKFCQYPSILYLCSAVVSNAPHVIMAYIHRQVKMIAPVDSMQGMVGKQNDNVCQKAIIFNLRKARTNTNDGKPFQYFSVRSAVGIKQTASQMEWNAKFKQIVADTRDRMQDPQYIATDKVAFATQTKYKTLYSYVFNQVKAKLA